MIFVAVVDDQEEAETHERSGERDRAGSRCPHDLSDLADERQPAIERAETRLVVTAHDPAIDRKARLFLSEQRWLGRQRSGNEVGSQQRQPVEVGDHVAERIRTCGRRRAVPRIVGQINGLCLIGRQKIGRRIGLGGVGRRCRPT